MDGCHDRPAFTDALYALVTAGGEAGTDEDGFRGIPLGAADRRPLASRITARVLSGEQSNTSIIYRPDDDEAGVPVICKLFRQVNPGINPDVELQSALAAAGPLSCPAPSARCAESG